MSIYSDILSAICMVIFTARRCRRHRPNWRGRPPTPVFHNSRHSCNFPSCANSFRPSSDRARRHAGCHRHRGNATITCSKRLRRRDQTTAPFVEKRRYRRKPLPDGFNIDHHHNIWYDCTVVNPYFTLSKVDSVIFGQALTKLMTNTKAGGQSQWGCDARLAVLVSSTP